MWMLDVEILKYFDWIRAVLLSCWDCLKNFPKSSDDIVNYKFILLCDYESTFLILFSKQPTVDPFSN